MLYALALIPVIGLLAFIYFNDKKEKEPLGFLIGLFFAGMGTIITAVIAEVIGELIVNSIIPKDTVLNQVIVAILIVGTAEELGKYLVLRIFTWRSKELSLLTKVLSF